MITILAPASSFDSTFTPLNKTKLITYFLHILPSVSTISYKTESFKLSHESEVSGVEEGEDKCRDSVNGNGCIQRSHHYKKLIFSCPSCTAAQALHRVQTHSSPASPSRMTSITRSVTQSYKNLCTDTSIHRGVG